MTRLCLAPSHKLGVGYSLGEHQEQARKNLELTYLAQGMMFKVTGLFGLLLINRQINTAEILGVSTHYMHFKCETLSVRTYTEETFENPTGNETSYKQI